MGTCFFPALNLFSSLTESPWLTIPGIKAPTKREPVRSGRTPSRRYNRLVRDHPLLIAFGGLPGTGKTTLAQAVAKKYTAVYLRIDTIETAIRITQTSGEDVGPVGYVIAYRVAEENLRLGQVVVADSVNPLQITRESWSLVATNAAAPLVEIEVLCSDPAEHRRRIESRPPDPDGLPPLTWASVCERTYEKWPAPHIVIDTAGKSIPETERELIDRLSAARK
jgi:predicted kinase